MKHNFLNQIKTMKPKFILTGIGLLIVLTNNVFAIDADSAFLRLSSSITVNTTGYVNVLQKTITITEPNTRVLIVADGRYRPISAPAGSMWLAINGSKFDSSVAVLDWGSSNKNASAQHSFNVLAYKVMQPGVHTFSLRAGAHPSRPGSFKVGSKSGMSIILNPGDETVVNSMRGESGNIDVTTYSPPGIVIVEGSLGRPSISILNNSIVNNTSVTKSIVSMSSARAFKSCSGRGDALIGIFQDSICQWTDSASWSVNDIDPGAELQAPMYANSFHAIEPFDTTNISFRASELSFASGISNPVHENQVCYKLGSAKLVSVVGSQISGQAGGDGVFCSTYTWKCVASTIGHGKCPTASTDSVIASKIINIPSNHNGIVFLSAKTRIQASNDDGYLTARLGIKVNGVKKGTIGIQQLRVGFGVASRTLSASYLSANGPNSFPLTPGAHLIEVYVNVQGSPIKHASVPEELSLVYFD